ncbi:MAG TPA: hypothetical protein VGQ44_07915 [Gemmatimonadaceae bacterium]|jgi:hypothetical protein|nr:hypothetical protein [Gemmatimonadaceae bacterium]
MKKLSSLAAAAALGVASQAPAQTFGDASAYVALMRTAVAGLPPIATSTILGERQNGAAFSARYGNVSGGEITNSLNNFTATAVLSGGGASSVSLTAGASTPSRGSTALVLGIGGDTRLSDIPMSDSRNGMLLRVGLNGEFGYSKPTNATLLAGSVGLPLSLISRGGRNEMHVVPFLTPAFGFGDFNPENGDSGSGSKFMLGGGVGIFNPTSSVALNLAFQHVFVDGGQTEFGLGLVLGGR